MTLKEFVSKRNNTKVDFDGAYGQQCVDLFRQYNADVFGNPHTGVVEGAVDLYNQYDKLPVEKQYYERITYMGDLPQEGDVVVFNGTSTNKYGHVAIVLWACGSYMAVFEQDGIAQTGAHIGTWDYKRVAGFLRIRPKR